MSPDSKSLEAISSRLLATTNLAQPLKKLQDSQLTATIADLHFHPSLEALLHILNADLPSAHFLVRHMQAPPAVEGMLLHGILHRAEGDFNNARAWVGDVVDACEGWVPKERDEGQNLSDSVIAKVQGSMGSGVSLTDYVYQNEDPLALIDKVETLRKTKRNQRQEGEEIRIEENIRAELKRVLEWCVKKFGDQEWVDASAAWVKDSEEVRKISNDMVSGDKGYRKF